MLRLFWSGCGLYMPAKNRELRLRPLAEADLDVIRLQRSVLTAHLSQRQYGYHVIAYLTPLHNMAQISYEGLA